jgi:peptidoglycan/xylan/chitin deacetylase (PgdA/CDA1 family)
MCRQDCAWLLVALLIGVLAFVFPAMSPAQVITSGPPSCPGIALTFDLCPVKQGSGYDQPLVDFLIQHQIPSTFFLSGKWMVRHEDEVTHLLRVRFFEVGTHGEVHAHLPLHDADAQRMEILGPVKTLQERYAHDATLFRPPYGEYNNTTIEVAKAIGLKFIQWNIESGDPDPTLSAEQILARVSKRAKPGSIIVFHANGKGNHTRQVVERLIMGVFPQKGLKPMTVNELLTCRTPAP